MGEGRASTATAWKDSSTPSSTGETLAAANAINRDPFIGRIWSHYWLEGIGDGTFGTARRFGVPRGLVAVAIGDFSGDGVLDLAVASNESNSVSVLLGIGDGTFGAERRFGVGTLPTAVAVGDFNGDGVLDLAGRFACAFLCGTNDSGCGFRGSQRLGISPR